MEYNRGVRRGGGRRGGGRGGVDRFPGRGSGDRFRGRGGYGGGRSGDRFGGRRGGYGAISGVYVGRGGGRVGVYGGGGRFGGRRGGYGGRGGGRVAGYGGRGGGRVGRGGGRGRRGGGGGRNHGRRGGGRFGVNVRNRVAMYGGRRYARINAYEFAFTYVPSHHRVNKRYRIRPHILEQRPYLMMHSLRSKSGKDNMVVVKSVIRREGSRGPMPKIPEGILEPLNRFWACLRYGVKNKDYREEQYHKHCSLLPLSNDRNYWVEGLRIGRKYVERGRKYDIVGILNRNGYKFGRVYKCKQLILDLERELKCSVRIRFKKIDGTRYLDEICVLYSTNLKRLNCKQDHDFEENDDFTLEDFPRRVGAKNRKASSKMHSIGIRLRCFRSRR